MFLLSIRLVVKTFKLQMLLLFPSQFKKKNLSILCLVENQLQMLPPLFQAVPSSKSEEVSYVPLEVTVPSCTILVPNQSAAIISSSFNSH